ncbi:Sugar phosphate transporter domain-containing protein [Plasmodiophora brassicae]|uniref:Sugar phosphate transporter domain-containing protein n=1 Tax=Plasmodiophora brassicae TaxID=37360 RepID=A0A0G4J768_PLABS|nr:hypothetical protein PBRA_003221 [Plasmodiophora brassicae]SPQ95694.1 unnamed protein product [Plasmodiophora brassicae]
MAIESVVLAGIVANIASSVGIVITNKFVWSAHGFNFVATLSFLHFVTTALATRTLLAARFFEYKPAPLAGVMPVAIGTLGSVAFMNLNLAANSVGFYQISKLACIPATLILQYLLFKKQVSEKTRYSLLVILLGVGISTVTDVNVNFIGMAYALIAVAFTALGQIYTGSSQQQLGLDSMQLLHHSSPIIAVGMFVCIFLFDDVGALLQFEYTSSAVFLIALTCVLAVGVNVSNYLVIGKTSPITYQVVGHSKTCLVLVLGFLAFSTPVTLRSIAGIVIAMAGVIWYGEVKRVESNASAKLPQYVSVSKNDIALDTFDDGKLSDNEDSA